MAEARQETQVWTVTQVLAWLSAHLEDGHDVRLPRTDAEDEDRTAGVFACSCGAAIEARPVVAYQPAPGLYAVTGPVPLVRPPLTGPPLLDARAHLGDGASALAEATPGPRAVLSLITARRRIRLSVGLAGACVDLDAGQARSLSRGLQLKADELERSVPHGEA